jgi:predicted ATP-binding protein involved in virulence
MYIKKVNIENIKSIKSFEMEFENPAGWHVLIGDNGSGKSGIIQAIALALIGSDEIAGIQPNWNDFLKWGENNGTIQLAIISSEADSKVSNGKYSRTKYNSVISLKREDNVNIRLDSRSPFKSVFRSNYSEEQIGWFSAGYGPFRRFTGGSEEMGRIFNNPSYSRLASHLSLFREDVALTEISKWLMGIKFKTLEKRVNKSHLEQIKRFINSSGFLPHGTELKDVNSTGVSFRDGNGADVLITQMSDGYRSILSLTFELIRQLSKVYGDERLFENAGKENTVIDLPGVVLIDEIDAHLHPSWQTRIGQWFTEYFPNIQFIVTTHSPLVCRASEKGTIWRLAEPGTGLISGEITGLEKEKLIFGNILDAYGTEVFGKSPVRSQRSDDNLQRLGKLNMLSALGKISEEDEKERLILQQTLSSDAPTGKKRPASPDSVGFE